MAGSFRRGSPPGCLRGGGDVRAEGPRWMRPFGLDQATSAQGAYGVSCSAPVRAGLCDHRTVQEVAVDAVELGRLESLLDVERRARLARSAERGRALLEGRTVWNISSTAAGGGVAEMLQTLLAYSRGAQVNSRWLVLGGGPRLFPPTNRVHNMPPRAP